MNRIIINGVEIVSSSGNVDIVGGRVVIDGVTQSVDISSGAEIRVTEGSINNLTTDRSVRCLNVGGNVEAGGSVNCDRITGSVRAGGSVNCDDIGGDVRAGGSVNCDDIGGSVTASVVKRG